MDNSDSGISDEDCNTLITYDTQGRRYEVEELYAAIDERNAQVSRDAVIRCNERVRKIFKQLHGRFFNTHYNQMRTYDTHKRTSNFSNRDRVYVIKLCRFLAVRKRHLRDVTALMATLPRFTRRYVNTITNCLYRTNCNGRNTDALTAEDKQYLRRLQRVEVQRSRRQFVQVPRVLLT
ncbi:unnamed protein product [Trichogramma brassicae]|uniref:Uncharacterized protein n=1 Tax=Trichogramma brassicae TaxID=86971 RepID=A0A6H5I9L5_9HYME|nr:unnamed protein product [Trichogramma brassicae]